MRLFFLLAILLFNSATFSQSDSAVRARQLNIPFDGKPGKFNAITDVPGLLVGYTTLIEGSGKLMSGKGPVRTGVTVILPKGKNPLPYAAAWFSLNGDGELTGLPYIEDHGMGYGPIGITNTNSVGVVRDAIGVWSFKNFSRGEFIDFSFGLPVVGETWDGMLNDINGFHVKEHHVWAAIDNARSGILREGNVGGGTGMMLYEFKGGTGTASREILVDGKKYTLGVLVQANFGRRQELTIRGVPVGKEIKSHMPVYTIPGRKDGSIIAIVATDAPMLPGQLKLIAKRVTHGIARTGTFSHNSSGEMFLALSTSEPLLDTATNMEIWKVIPKSSLDAFFEATVQATEEAIINALVAAKDMEGINGNKWFAIPHNELRQVMRKYRPGN